MSEHLREFRPGEDDLGVDALWARCFGEAAGGQTAGWLFRDGPAGNCARMVAESDGRIVAHAGVTNLRFQLRDEVVRGGYSVAAMTDPEMRGRRLFYRLGCALYERMESEGYAFVAGFSNSQSVRLMTGPLHRTPIAPFPWCVKPLRPLALARALLVGAGARPPEASPQPLTRLGIRVTEVGVDDPRFDEVWSRCRSEQRMAGVRDTAFAHWRYGTRPDANYRLVIALRGEEALGWAGYRSLSLRGLRGGFVVDLVVAPRELRAGAALLAALEDTARREGAELMSALRPQTGTAADCLRRASYWRVPERLHPQNICFSVRGLGKWEGCPELVEPRAWHISWADTDVV